MAAMAAKQTALRGWLLFACGFVINSLFFSSNLCQPVTVTTDNHHLLHSDQHEKTYQFALNTLLCFITPRCFPRLECQSGEPKRIKRRKKWEEMSFCADDLKKSADGKSSGQKCLVYSFGIHAIMEWETKVAQIFGCDVHAFDPTVMHNNTKHVTFHQWGLQGEGTDVSQTHAHHYGALDPARLFTLNEIMERLGHQGRKIDALMLDCEGCEWGVLKQLICNNRGSDSVEQLILEAHFQKALGLADEKDVLLAAEAITCLRHEGWGMVSQEASGCSGKDATYARGVREILPSFIFLMYTTLRRNSTRELNKWMSPKESRMYDRFRLLDEPFSAIDAAKRSNS